MKLSQFGKLSVLIVTAASALTFSHLALAQPEFMDVGLDCPDPIGHTEVILNFGTYVAGNGFERINKGALTKAFFKGEILKTANIPANLQKGSYLNAGTNYSPTTGRVQCHYISTAGYDPFDAYYTLQNGKGGVVTKSSAEEIHIKIMLGIA